VSRERQLTWAELGYRNSNLRDTARALKFALGWGLATAELGREPASIEEYGELAQESRASAFRDQQAFRRAFPDEVSPLRMNQLSGAQARYDELFKTYTLRKTVVAAAQPFVYILGGSPVLAGSGDLGLSPGVTG